MSTEYNAVQESIKIALDAADAATDVTSEYNKTKREHKKLEASVKSVHRFSIIIFASSMVAAVAALLFAGMIYFRTMSELNTMTTTSREALVVFAENVEGVNDALDKMKNALDTQQTLVGQNEQLINELVGLRDIISRSNETMMTGLKTTTGAISDNNANMASSITTGIANELGAQTNRVVKELNALSSANAKAMEGMSKTVSNSKNMDRLAANQKNIVRSLNDLAAQNNELVRLLNEKDNRVSYP
jgi:prophage DNA circulation protein